METAHEGAALLLDARARPVEELVEVLPVLREGRGSHGEEDRAALLDALDRVLAPDLVDGAAEEHERAEVVGLGEEQA